MSATPAPYDLVILEPANQQFRHADHRLQLRQDDGEWVEVVLALLFPLSDPTHWISLCNTEGKEIGVLKTMKGLLHDSLIAVKQELDRRYIVPKIERITACLEHHDIYEWIIETDRGRLTFFMRNAYENIQRPIPNRVIMIDIEGNRYDIEDLSALDAESLRLLELRM